MIKIWVTTLKLEILGTNIRLETGTPDTNLLRYTYT